MGRLRPCAQGGELDNGEKERGGQGRDLSEAGTDGFGEEGLRHGCGVHIPKNGNLQQ